MMLFKKDNHVLACLYPHEWFSLATGGCTMPSDDYGEEVSFLSLSDSERAYLRQAISTMESEYRERIRELQLIQMVIKE